MTSAEEWVGRVDAVAGRLERTVAILERRGYALPPGRLGQVCVGGALPEAAVLAVVASRPGLALRSGLVVPRGLEGSAGAIARRAAGHQEHARRCLRRLGGQVTVVELDPIRALEAVLDGMRVTTLEEALGIGEVFFTATGRPGVIAGDSFDRLPDGAILANAGHFPILH